MIRHCRIDGCPTPAAEHRNVCYRHQNRIRRYGDPHTTHRTLTHPDEIPPVVDDRLPDHSLTFTDRRTAAALLTSRGVHPAEIANLLGVTERTIYRWKAHTPA